MQTIGQASSFDLCSTPQVMVLEHAPSSKITKAQAHQRHAHVHGRSVDVARFSCEASRGRTRATPAFARASASIAAGKLMVRTRPQHRIMYENSFPVIFLPFTCRTLHLQGRGLARHSRCEASDHVPSSRSAYNCSGWALNVDEMKEDSVLQERIMASHELKRPSLEQRTLDTWTEAGTNGGLLQANALFKSLESMAILMLSSLFNPAHLVVFKGRLCSRDCPRTCT